MFVATAVLSGLLTFAFGGGAVGKVTRMRTEVDKAAKFRMSWDHYRLIAVPEAAAAIGLLAGLAVAPLGVAAAIGLVALMIGALAYRVRAHDAIRFMIGDAALLVMAGVTAVMRAVTA